MLNLASLFFIWSTGTVAAVELPVTVRSGGAETDGARRCDFRVSRQMDGTWKLELEVLGDAEIFGRTVTFAAAAYPLRAGWAEVGGVGPIHWRYAYADSILTIEDEYPTAQSPLRTLYQITVDPALRMPTLIRIRQFGGSRESMAVICDPSSS